MMATLFLIGGIVTILLPPASMSSQMNPLPYLIANPLQGKSSVQTFRGEYFEFYGHNHTTRYGDVDWRQDSVDLPQDIVQRFDGKVMVVTGYEVNIVRTNPTTGSEESVPAWEQYNHHYTGYLYGKKMKISTRRDSPHVHGSHGSDLPFFERNPTHKQSVTNETCSIAGVWLNTKNNIRVNITKSSSECMMLTSECTQYKASCIGDAGWDDAEILVTPAIPGAPQGSAKISISSSPQSDTTGDMATYAAVEGCPPCSQLSWLSGGTWVLEPYADMKPTPTPTADIPSVVALSEGNGNEHRVSYKGFAEGIGMLIFSPTTMANNAMIINTNKRLTNDKSPGPIGGPLPRTSLAPKNADYQGILECPCTTRGEKIVDGYVVHSTGVCPSQVETIDECAKAATLSGLITDSPPTSINSLKNPAGCQVLVKSADDLRIVFNTNYSSTVPCGPSSASTRQVGSGIVGGVSIHLDINVAAKTATVTLGADVGSNWFGFGLNGSVMQNTFAIVIDGTGAVSERRLGDHEPGQLLANSAKVVSSTLNNTVRSVVLQFPLSGPNFDFRGIGAGALPTITAIGSSPNLSYHSKKTLGDVVLGEIGSTTCLCRDPSANTGTIFGNRFAPNCAAFPVGELESTHNSICNISEYNGGLYCCHGGVVLLDADQPQPNATDTWRMKYRFHFEEYTNQSNAFRTWWSTEAYDNEYNIPKSKANCLDPATPAEMCIHKIRSNFTGKQFVAGSSACMVGGDPAACGDIKRIESESNGFFRLAYAAFHCHAPACISGELWNDDTGELICRNEAVYGTGTKAFNESAYVTGIPPCVWGTEAEGLAPFPILHLTSNLSTVKRGNSTNGHWGVMALWQARATYMPATNKSF